MTSDIKEKNICKVELHIHTPSSKCYKGAKDDDEYLRIIEKANSKALNIIAITDHNSIKGYEKIIQIKDRIQNEIRTLEEINDSVEAQSKLKQLRKQNECFNSMLILPGVEFEVNNGIHILVIFNPETSISIISTFLQKGGFDDDSFGQENDVFSKWSLFDLYKESLEYDCVIIDAHTDSDKGIYNTLVSGTTRVHAFTNKSLVGVCYKSEKQKTNIQNLLKDPKYKRTTPLAFLKSSDSHNINEIGKYISYFRLSDITWNDFKEAFLNPTECIFTVYPKVQSIIKNVTSTSDCLYIEKFTEDTKNTFTKDVCALANTDGGFILIGGESSEIINGIVINNEDQLKTDLNNLFDFLKNMIAYDVMLTSSIYPINTGYCIIIVKVNKTEELIDIEKSGQIYYFHKGQVTVLCASKIEKIISDRCIEKISMQIQNELTVIKKSTSAIETYFKSIPILNSYKERSSSISSILEVVDLLSPIKLNNEQKNTISQKYIENENGKSRGNIYYFKSIPKPRLQDAYLRISLPKFNIIGLPETKRNSCLFVTPGGAVYYTEREVHIYNPYELPILKVITTSDYSIKFLCAFLKSSFFIWYCLNKFDTLDFFQPKFFNLISVPCIHKNSPKDINIVKEIEEKFDKILAMEKEFLKNYVSKASNLEDEIINHNKRIANVFNEIDDLIFDLLNLHEEDKQIIKENLQSRYIYVQ